MRPLFSSDWPRYAIAAHIVFWAASALMIVTGLAAFAGLVSRQLFIWFLWLWIISGLALSLAAAYSAKLYVGDQVFKRTPTTGWSARLIGILLSAGIGLLFLYVYALTGMHG